MLRLRADLAIAVIAALLQLRNSAACATLSSDDAAGSDGRVQARLTRELARVYQTDPAGELMRPPPCHCSANVEQRQVWLRPVTMCDWDLPPKTLTLDQSEIHVWRAALDLPIPSLLRLRQTLDADELARVRRFHFQEDRDGFIAAHGVKRSILARYLGTKPSALRFALGPQLKPFLVPPPAQERVHFNLTHSHGLALVAVARGREVGVDLEYMRSDVAAEALAERFFSPQEVAALQGLPANARAEAFYRAWTRKESYLKATGEGLTAPLSDFAVPLVPSEPAEILWVQENDQEASRWSLRHLEPGPGYVGAVAAEGSDWKLACWQWIDP